MLSLRIPKQKERPASHQTSASLLQPFQGHFGIVIPGPLVRARGGKWLRIHNPNPMLELSFSMVTMILSPLVPSSCGIAILLESKDNASKLSLYTKDKVLGVFWDAGKGALVQERNLINRWIALKNTAPIRHIYSIVLTASTLAYGPDLSHRSDLSPSCNTSRQSPHPVSLSIQL